MGKLFSILVLLALVAGAKSQSYTPFPEDTAVWEARYYPPPGGPFTVYDFYRYTQMGDTLINATSYNKIYQQHYQETYMQVPTYTYGPVGYYAALRQDSVNRKVYVFFKDSTSELLLYDFSIKHINDTIHPAWIDTDPTMQLSTASCAPNINQCNCNCAIINRVDSLLSPWGRYYKAYGFNGGYWGGGGWAAPQFTFTPTNSYYDGYLIEGIGSSWGLFEKLYSTYEYAGYNLVKFCDSKYGFCDAMPLGINEKADVAIMQIAPNPVSDYFEISNAPYRAIISLYDALGNLHLSHEISEQSSRMDVSQLAKGIYFAEIKTATGKTIRKIIKD